MNAIVMSVEADGCDHPHYADSRGGIHLIVILRTGANWRRFSTSSTGTASDTRCVVGLSSGVEKICCGYAVAILKHAAARHQGVPQVNSCRHRSTRCAYFAGVPP